MNSAMTSAMTAAPDSSVLFILDGKPVVAGQELFVARAYHWAAGVKAKVERFYGDCVLMRTDNGAVPTVPLNSLSWEPCREAADLEALRAAGFRRPSHRDLEVWRASRDAALAAIEAAAPDALQRNH